MVSAKRAAALCAAGRKLKKRGGKVAKMGAGLVRKFCP